MKMDSSTGRGMAMCRKGLRFGRWTLALAIAVALPATAAGCDVNSAMGVNQPNALATLIQDIGSFFLDFARQIFAAAVL